MPIKDPLQHLVISRKRKRYKFASYNSFKNCFSHGRDDDPAVIKKALKDYFKDKNLKVKRPLILELAAGNADFSFQLAKKYPSTDFIAIDIKSDRLYTSAKQALAEKITNLAFLRMNIEELYKVFSGQSVATIWLTFPDPYMRKRSQRRRLTHPRFLKIYRKLLPPSGSLKFKTDNRELFLWSLEQFVEASWQIKELSFDLHESILPEDYKIKTHYEQRFSDQDIPINFISLKPS